MGENCDFHMFFLNENQPGGLAKVIDASEASLGGPGAEGHVPGGNWVTVGFNCFYFEPCLRAP